MNVSKYSCFTDEKLEERHAELTDKYAKMVWNLLLDDSRSLEDKKNELSLLIDGNELNEIRECLFVFTKKKLEEFSKIIYISMDKRKDFGNSYEQAVSISFCRKILNIFTGRCVFQDDADKFRQIINECDKANGYKSGDEYLDYIKTYQLEIFGKSFPAGNFNKFNPLFELLDVDGFIWETTTRHYVVRVAFGKLTKHETEGNEYLIMEEEWTRSPQLILSIAAEVYENTTIIRQKACEVIYHNKWERDFEQSLFEREYALYNINSNIREGLKKAALKYFGITSKAEALKKKDDCINIMCIGIVWHEMGHHVANSDMKPEHYEFHNTYCETDNAGFTVQEMLADWAPQKGSKKGTFSFVAELAQTNKQLATAYIYMYMSDNWFIDEVENKKYSLLSHVAIGLVMQFINSDSTVDFDSLSGEIDPIYNFLKKRFANLTDKLIENIKNSTYDFGIKQLDYSQLEPRIDEMHRQKSRGDEPYEELTRNNYWIDVLDNLEKFSKDGWKRHNKILKREAVLLQKAILKMVTKDDGGKYSSLREYVVEKAKKIGIMEKIHGINRFPVDKPENQVSGKYDIEAYFEELIAERRF